MRTLAAFALMFSVQAFACPQLTGSFTCKNSDGTSEVITLKQNIKNGVTIYDYNGSSIPADNTVYPVPDDANIKGGTFRAWCDDDITLKAQMLGKYWNNGSYFGDLTLNISYSLSNANLHQTSTGEIVNTGGKYPLNGDLVCTKNP